MPLMHAGDASPRGALLDVLFADTPIGIAFINPDLRYLGVNAAYARLGGGEPEAYTGRRIDEVLPTLASRMAPAIRQAFDSDRAVDFELPDAGTEIGTESRHWTGIYQPLILNGRAVAVAAMVRDVTERRRIERLQGDRLNREQQWREEAERQRDFFRLVLENAPIAVTIREGAEHRLVLMNDFAHRLVGMPREALIGQPLGEQFRDAFNVIRQSYEHAYGTGEVVTIPEVRLPLPDGRKLWVYLCFAPIKGPDRSPLGVMSLGVDISLVKQSQALVESQKDVLEAISQGKPLESILDTIVRAVADQAAPALPCILLADAEGRVLRHGASAGQLPESYTAAMDGLAVGPGTPWCGTAAFERRRIVVEDLTADPSWTAFREMASAAGIRACWSTPIIGSDDRLLGTFGISYRQPKAPTADEINLLELMVRMTAFAVEWCRADEQRRALLEAERAARADAEAANRSKDEFVATLSHELRTPLNAILGWARMLRAGQVEPAAHEKALEAIERNTRAQAQLVEDLLDISRIVTGKLRLDVRSVELSSVVDAAIDALMPAADAKGIRVQKVIDPRAAPIAGDPDRLQQVVWNLMSNAIKFTSKGGRVQVRLERINSHVEIVVSDTGIGIPPEVIGHVFERFRQGHRTGEKGAGLGLGLAIARHLVELHGGSIDVVSEGVGHGATFRVKLPLVAAQPQRAPGDIHPTAGSGLMSADLPRLPRVRLLVVEDDEDGRDIVRMILANAGADVRTAASAADGFELATTWKPDVLISDIEMPQEDGYAFVSRLRQQPGCSAREMPAIALTAYARVEDRIRALSAGFQMHVPKPVEPAELIAVVAALIPTSEST